MTTLEKDLHDLLNIIALTGRTVNYSHEFYIEALPAGSISPREEWCACIFKHGSFRVEKMFTHPDIEFVVRDVEEYMGEKGIK